MSDAKSAAMAPTLFGFTLNTALPFRFAREGGGVRSLEVRSGPVGAERPREGLVVEWPLKGGETEVMASLYDVPGGLEYWTSDAGRFFISTGGDRIEVPSLEDKILQEQRTNGIPMALAYTAQGDIALHTAAVLIDDAAVLLAAPSRFGKTTLAMAFAERGYEILSEDLIGINVADATVRPGPAIIRLRPDVYSGTPPAGWEEVAVRPDRVFLSPPVGRRGSGAARALRAVALLREGSEIRLSKASPIETVKDLWALNFRLPTNEDRSGSFRALTALVGQVPTWNLERPFRLDALGETVEAITKCART